MTTYVYETVPQQVGEKPRYHEIQQRMNDAPLTRHPETGEPIRHVVLGGFGTLSSKAATSGPSSGCGCTPGRCGD